MAEFARATSFPGYLTAPATRPSAEGNLPSEIGSLVRTQFSIIIPVLNEAQLIRPFLSHLRARAPGGEIIVVDGGSADGTPDLAAGLCDQFITTGANRAVQMNAGAAVAHGEILWFLHVDTEIPAGSLQLIEHALQNRQIAGGYFRIQLPRKNPVYRLTDSFAHYAGLALRIRCGDHGMFCRRRDFVELGGFPEVPLMEDVEFFRMLRRGGRMRAIKQRLIVNPRRYEKVGPLRLNLAYGLIATLYTAGAPLPILMSIYSRLCSCSK